MKIVIAVASIIGVPAGLCMAGIYAVYSSKKFMDTEHI